MHYFHYMDTESQDEPIAVYVALDDEAWPLQALFGVKMANTHAWLLAQQQSKRESPRAMRNQKPVCKNLCLTCKR